MAGVVATVGAATVDVVVVATAAVGATEVGAADTAADSEVEAGATIASGVDADAGILKIGTIMSRVTSMVLGYTQGRRPQSRRRAGRQQRQRPRPRPRNKSVRRGDMRFSHHYGTRHTNSEIQPPPQKTRQPRASDPGLG